MIVAFDREDHAREFKAFLDQSALSPADEKSASTLWEKRFLPMSIKHLGPSLLASEVLLPLDQVAPYHQKITEWGKRLGVTFYPTAHLVNPEEVLFLAMVATDHRKSLFYADLVLIPMMLRLAVKQFKGKPYGLGIWNTPFLKDLYPKKELKELIRYKKKVDPAGILNPGKFFDASGKLGPFQKMLFHPDVFDLGLATTQWLMLRFFSIIPDRKAPEPGHGGSSRIRRHHKGRPFLRPVRELCGEMPGLPGHRRRNIHRQGEAHCRQAGP